MANTDLLMAFTAARVGPESQDRTTPKVVYIKASDLKATIPGVRNSRTILKVNDPSLKKIEVYETPAQVLGVQAQSQGATANAYAVANYGTFTATSSATQADAAISKYFTEVNAGNGLSIRLPDPFVNRLCVVHNTLTGAITVRGRGATSAINGSTAGYTLPALTRRHFWAPTAATAGTTAGWKVAIDV